MCSSLFLLLKVVEPAQECGRVVRPDVLQVLHAQGRGLAHGRRQRREGRHAAPGEDVLLYEVGRVTVLFIPLLRSCDHLQGSPGYTLEAAHGLHAIQSMVLFLGTP